jgi:hypothetical protein
VIWQEIVKTALIGTDKTTPSVKTLEKLQNWGVKSNEMAEMVLEGAGISALMQKSGYTLQEYAENLPEPVEKEEGVLCSPKSAQHLKKILTDGNGGLLFEFLYHLQRYKKRLPSEFLPAILHLARGNKQLQANIVGIVGQRGIWLIRQNPLWSDFDINKIDEIKAPPQLHGQETLEEARQIRDIFRTNRALWTEENAIILRLKEFALKADPAFANKLEGYFEEELPYYWQQHIRQMTGVLLFRNHMIEEMRK